MKPQDYEQLTLFPEASRDCASRLVLPGSDEARKMTVTSGQKCCEFVKNCGPLGLLAKTLLESSIWHSTKCYLTWKVSVTPAKRLLFRLRPSMPRTGGIDVLSWATPTAADSYTDNMKSSQQVGESRHSLTLGRAVQLWPTPKASDYKGSGPAGSKSAEHDKQRGNLKGFVMYTTPTASDAVGSTGGNNGRSLRTDVGGQLNPDWVEWLMGLPVGWTSL